MELTQLAACCDALWALDAHGRVSIRTLSPSCPFGLHWASLDLNQLGKRLSRTLETVWSRRHITQPPGSVPALLSCTSEAALLIQDQIRTCGKVDSGTSLSKSPNSFPKKERQRCFSTDICHLCSSQTGLFDIRTFFGSSQ